MSLVISDLKVPIQIDAHGTARVAGTRVTLLSIITDFRNGATPEQILQDFDRLSLSDIYAVVTYYLQNRSMVDAYLAEEERLGDEVQQRMAALYPSQGLRERLLARRKEPARANHVRYVPF